MNLQRTFQYIHKLTKIISKTEKLYKNEKCILHFIIDETLRAFVLYGGLLEVVFGPINPDFPLLRKIYALQLKCSTLKSHFLYSTHIRFFIHSAQSDC